jgi:hypothetical protein
LASSSLLLREYNKQKPEELHALLKPRDPMFIALNKAVELQVAHTTPT